MNHSRHYWGLPSATIDWCEENYDMLSWTAEFYNSLSSLVFVALAILVYYHCSRQGYLRTSYVVAIVMMAVVGLGSVAFHATLLYEMQLLDELPMIYGASTMLYLAFDPRSQWSRRKRACLVALLTTAALLFTYYYVMVHRDPFYHQTYFALLLATFVVVTGWQIVHLPLPPASFTQAGAEGSFRAPLYRLLSKGCLILILAKAVWTIDNDYCAQLSHIRRTWLFFPLDSLLQFHTIWHVLSALALHYLMTVSIYIRENSQERPEVDCAIVYSCRMIPHVRLMHVIRDKVV